MFVTRSAKTEALRSKVLPPVEKTCDLYFFEMEATDRPIKIGRSTTTKKRLDALQIASPYNLTCIALLYGEGSWEPEWHMRFGADRMRGEWFMPSPALFAAIKAAQLVGSREALGFEPEPDWRAALGLVHAS